MSALTKNTKKIQINDSALDNGDRRDIPYGAEIETSFLLSVLSDVV